MKRQKVSSLSLKSQVGFTIVELMIATLVFSVVLLVITMGVLHFTNSYYKGINASTTQTTAQNAIDTISQAIQFSATDSSAGSLSGGAQNGAFCAGTKLFLYDKGYQYVGAAVSMSNPKTWGLFMIDNPNLNNCVIPPGTTDLSKGTELLSKNMRLNDISLAKVSTPGADQVWQLSLKVAYGDADLLCNTSKTGMTQGSCNPAATSYALTDPVTGYDVSCKSQTGSQFCSASTLSTVAEQRVSN